MKSKTDSPELVLGSASPRRRELLTSLGIPFSCGQAHGIDEDAVTGSARKRVLELAQRKADAVSARLESSRPSATFRVLGADTIVVAGTGDEDEDILGKPVDPDDACHMLARLSGSTHRVYTAVAVAEPAQPTVAEVEVTEVTFRELSQQEIETYVASGEPLDKAGAYGIQGEGRRLVATLRGCFYNVVGLPLVRTARLLGVPCECDCLRCDLQRGALGCRSS